NWRKVDVEAAEPSPLTRGGWQRPGTIAPRTFAMPFIPFMLCKRLTEAQAQARLAAALAQGRPAYRKAHSMRHTVATWGLEGNEEKGMPPAPILAVHERLGHASVKETEGYLATAATPATRAQRLPGQHVTN